MSVTAFLMFEGRAGEAIDFYVGLLGSEVVSMTRMADGRVQLAKFRLRNKPLTCHPLATLSCHSAGNDS